MTDRELIKEAREELRHTDNQFRPYPGYDLLEQLADRLESLTEEVGGPVVSSKRLAEIRRADAEWVGLRNPLAQNVHDLLVLYDESEKWCAVLANDRECDGGMIQIGVAKALDVMEKCACEDERAGDREGAAVIREAAAVVRTHCGPAPLPPHERTLAENRRMREALAEIAGRGVGMSPGSREIAREALLGGVLNSGTDTS